MTWNDTNQLPFKLFWWESPDGSKVLTYFPHDYANDNLNPVRLSYDVAQARERAPGITEIMDLYGIGDHGGGPTRAILDEGVHWMQPDKVMPKSKFGTAQITSPVLKARLLPDSPSVGLRSIAKGYKAPACAGRWPGRNSDMEERNVFRISPRRDDHAGQSQAQHARQ
jgi:alpha-mannosidase